MLSHANGGHDLLRSRRHDGRGRWLQRLVRSGGSSLLAAHLGLFRHSHSHSATLDPCLLRFISFGCPQLSTASYELTGARNTRCGAQNGPFHVAFSSPEGIQLRVDQGSAKSVRAYCRVIRHDDLHLRSTSDIGSVRTQKTERLMLSHAHGGHDLLRSRRRDGRGRWLQRLVRPGTRHALDALHWHPSCPGRSRRTYVFSYSQSSPTPHFASVRQRAPQVGQVKMPVLVPFSLSQPCVISDRQVGHLP
jgi:hypothetical protein